MQAADNVEFGGAFGDAFSGARVNFVERKSVRTRRVGRAAESAELAVGDANVGRVNVAIDVVVGDVAMLLFANVIREPAHAQKIVRFVEQQPVACVQTVAGENL